MHTVKLPKEVCPASSDIIKSMQNPWLVVELGETFRIQVLRTKASFMTTRSPVVRVENPWRLIMRTASEKGDQ